jgi:diguanylate cyclase (GGDEF)-like protein
MGEGPPFGVILDELWRVVAYRAAAALRLDGAMLRIVASRGGGAHEGKIDRASAPELYAVVEGRRVQELSDPTACLNALGLPWTAARALAVPLHDKQLPLGALVVAFSGTGPTAVGEEETLAQFAEHVAAFAALDGQQRRQQQARARAGAIGRFTRLAATRIEPKALLEAAAAEVLPLSGADTVVFYTTHDRNAVLIPRACGGRPPADPAWETQRIDLTSEPLASLVRERKPLAFHGGERLPPPELQVFGAGRSVVVIPLVVRDVVVGAAVLVSREAKTLQDSQQVERLHDVVQPIALGIENGRLFERLAEMAETDALTQLPNRRKLMETLRDEVAQAHRSRSPLSLLMVDIDHLKKINDAYGHPAGDAAIRYVADTLTRRRRVTDLPARMGGEEFAMLLPNTDLHAARTTAERICREVADTEVLGVGKVTVSVGVATLRSVDDGEVLIRHADERLYAAKTGGRNRVAVASLDEGVTPPDGSRLPGH